MKIIRAVAELRETVRSARSAGARIGLVPTMGAFHEGHLALMRRAREQSGFVVTSLFVNPTQFNDSADLARYPRHEARDAELARTAGASVLFAPSASEVYPDGFSTSVHVAKLSEPLEGTMRGPGHFRGVATVVAKLFGQVRPDIALFGEKDYQQLAVIRRLVLDLDLGIEIIGVATQRDADGLALSSRNAYLSAEERRAARALPRCLGEATAAIRDGADVGGTLTKARDVLTEAGFGPIDYVALCDASTLDVLDRLDRPARLLAAAFLGRTRLIDNMAVDPA